MLILARYKEDVSWSDEFGERRIVLDKSGDFITGIRENWMALPNVGREGHSYLFYIIQNYDNLPEGMVFSQADPSDHVFGMSSFTSAIHGVLHDLPDVYIPFSEKCNKIIGGIDGWDIVMPIQSYWEDLFVEPQPEEWSCYYAGLFYVSRNLVLRHPLCFYQYLYDKMDNEVHPYYGYVLERLWTPIFCGDYTSRFLHVLKT